MRSPREIQSFMRPGQGALGSFRRPGLGLLAWPTVCLLSLLLPARGPPVVNEGGANGNREAHRVLVDARKAPPIRCKARGSGTRTSAAQRKVALRPPGSPACRCRSLLDRLDSPGGIHGSLDTRHRRAAPPIPSPGGCQPTTPGGMTPSGGAPAPPARANPRHRRQSLIRRP